VYRKEFEFSNVEKKLNMDSKIVIAYIRHIAGGNTVVRYLYENFSANNKIIFLSLCRQAITDEEHPAAVGSGRFQAVHAHPGCHLYPSVWGPFRSVR
jgi:hypothetical protein